MTSTCGRSGASKNTPTQNVALQYRNCASFSLQLCFNKSQSFFCLFRVSMQCDCFFGNVQPFIDRRCTLAVDRPRIRPNQSKPRHVALGYCALMSALMSVYCFRNVRCRDISSSVRVALLDFSKLLNARLSRSICAKWKVVLYSGLAMTKITGFCITRSIIIYYFWLFLNVSVRFAFQPLKRAKNRLVWYVVWGDCQTVVSSNNAKINKKILEK